MSSKQATMKGKQRRIYLKPPCMSIKLVLAVHAHKDMQILVSRIHILMNSSTMTSNQATMKTNRFLFTAFMHVLSS